MISTVISDISVVIFQEGTDDGTAIMIVGNKTDLVEDDSERAVKSQDGKKLAEVHAQLAVMNRLIAVVVR